MIDSLWPEHGRRKYHKPCLASCCGIICPLCRVTSFVRCAFVVRMYVMHAIRTCCATGSKASCYTSPPVGLVTLVQFRCPSPSQLVVSVFGQCVTLTTSATRTSAAGKTGHAQVRWLVCLRGLALTRIGQNKYQISLQLRSI